MTDSYFNISKFLPEMAMKYPFQKAVVFPENYDEDGNRAYSHLTFKQLNEECDRYAHGLSKSGLKEGDKVLLMVKPSLKFIAITFALFKMGTIPILIDPGMGKKRLLECIKDVSPDAVVGIPKAHFVRLLFRKYFKSSKVNIVVGDSFSFLGINLDRISNNSIPFEFVKTKENSQAAILFTSGSTGPAKGVLYEHGMFKAQVELLKKEFGFLPGEVDMPGLAVFALFDVALGMTCVIPDMDPTRPALVNPKNIVELVNDFGVTTSYGSPAIWKQVGAYCEKNDIEFPSFKRVLMSGAPVPGWLVEQFKKIIPNGDIQTPYGATESLPVASICGDDILKDTVSLTNKGKGICVGYPTHGISVLIIKITDDVIENLDESIILKDGSIGEIIVNGPSVTKEYYKKEEATKKAKIYDSLNIWHRIGDTGYIDEKGRVWVCGRKSHLIRTVNGILFPLQFEAIFNLHDKVYRSALVGVGDKNNQKPVIIIEPFNGFYPNNEKEKETLIDELLHISKQFEHTKVIDKIMFYKSFPVDIRHNAKIFREKLSIWAERNL